MHTLQIEHAISDFDVWKRAFDSDPLRREESGVRAYRVYRPVDDPQYVQIDLDFDTSSAADEFHVKLRELWESGRATPALVGGGRGRVVEEVLREEY
jgi:hypothetical protein